MKKLFYSLPLRLWYYLHAQVTLKVKKLKLLILQLLLKIRFQVILLQ